LARIHTEAIGGTRRVQALTSLKATGVTRLQGRELAVVIWAERPNRIRTEVTAGGRISTQAYDGKNAPWQMAAGDVKVLRMEGDGAAEFRADAEFDDPLIAPTRARVALDYAGEAEVGGRPVFRVLVTQNFVETSFVYVDQETYFIVRREVVRRRGGRAAKVFTDYGDFRAVAGVILPHKITVRLGERVLHETTLANVEPNVVMPTGTFAAPLAVGVP
jgi:hypothetical protein